MILRRGQCLRNGDSPLSALLPHTPHPTLRPRIRRDFHGGYPARSRWPSRIRGRVTVGSRRGVVNTCDTREEPLKYSASAPWRVQIAILVAYDRGSSCLPPSPTRGTSRLSRRWYDGRILMKSCRQRTSPGMSTCWSSVGDDRLSEDCCQARKH